MATKLVRFNILLLCSINKAYFGLAKIRHMATKIMVLIAWLAKWVWLLTHQAMKLTKQILLQKNIWAACRQAGLACEFDLRQVKQEECVNARLFLR